MNRDTYWNGMPKGSRVPEASEVIPDMLRAAAVAGSGAEVVTALKAVYGEQTVEDALDGLELAEWLRLYQS